MSDHYASMLLTRRKILSAAVNHLFGNKTLSGRKAADCYAKLLGFENNNKLKYEISRDNPLVETRIQCDWNSGHINALEAFSEYIPDLSADQLYTIDYMSEPRWNDIKDEVWKEKLLCFLGKINDIRELRSFKPANQIQDGVPYFLIELADGQVYNTKARNRFMIIVTVLMELANQQLINQVRWQDIHFLYTPTPFQFLLNIIYGGPEGDLLGHSTLSESVKRYADMDWGSFKNHNLGSIEFDDIFSQLGVEVENPSLSPDADVAIFGEHGGFEKYYQMQKDLHKMFQS